MTAISWLPNEDFDNYGKSLNGYPLFLGEEPFELIWSYKDNTQPTSQKMDIFYETKAYGAVFNSAVLGLDAAFVPIVGAMMLLGQALF
mmetsp:Transcript_40094/g.52529  ORF Transcript_40094/g.52529 Transcript_40094/m.52529 type:complete len:88 (+) Transcript_40094:397-660(+)